MPVVKKAKSSKNASPIAPQKTRSGGRPSQERAQRIGEEILDIATAMFMSQGYGATSIEAIAKQAGMSKRTFYHRFANKAELFSAVVHRLTMRLRPKQVAPLFTGGTLRDILLRLALIIQRASLMPDALALHRLMLTEANRFPELANILDEQGVRREAVGRIAALLQSQSSAENRTFLPAEMLAEQFMQMVVSIPQRRALGLGTAMDAQELSRWAEQAVDLFLHGCELS